MSFFNCSSIAENSCREVEQATGFCRYDEKANVCKQGSRTPTQQLTNHATFTNKVVSDMCKEALARKLTQKQTLELLQVIFLQRATDEADLLHRFLQLAKDSGAPIPEATSWWKRLWSGRGRTMTFLAMAVVATAFLTNAIHTRTTTTDVSEYQLEPATLDVLQYVPPTASLPIAEEEEERNIDSGIYVPQLLDGHYRCASVSTSTLPNNIDASVLGFKSLETCEAVSHAQSIDSSLQVLQSNSVKMLAPGSTVGVEGDDMQTRTVRVAVGASGGSSSRVQELPGLVEKHQFHKNHKRKDVLAITSKLAKQHPFLNTYFNFPLTRVGASEIEPRMDGETVTLFSTILHSAGWTERRRAINPMMKTGTIGLRLLNSVGWVHGDPHHGNLLYNKDAATNTYTFRFTDFDDVLPIGDYQTLQHSWSRFWSNCAATAFDDVTISGSSILSGLGMRGTYGSTRILNALQHRGMRADGWPQLLFLALTNDIDYGLSSGPKRTGRQIKARLHADLFLDPPRLKEALQSMTESIEDDLGIMLHNEAENLNTPVRHKLHLGAILASFPDVYHKSIVNRLWRPNAPGFNHGPFQKVWIQEFKDFLVEGAYGEVSF